MKPFLFVCVPGMGGEDDSWSGVREVLQQKEKRYHCFSINSLVEAGGMEAPVELCEQ